MRFCLILFSLLFASCGREPLYHSQSYVFGTLVDISIYGEKEPRALALTEHIFADFQALHNQLHAWNGTSELSQLNAAFAKGTQANPISPRMAEILNSAQQLSIQSDGLFNPAIGHLIGLWGFQSDTFSAKQVPALDIENLVKQKPSMQDLSISATHVSSSNSAVKLDLGGFAKGYALDQARNYLKSQGVKHALINIGGNVIALGQHGSKPWRVGIQHPRQPNAMASLDLPDGWAIGTSGDYQRYFELNGKRYCHLLDPNTGYPATFNQAVSVLVAPSAQAGTLSDVASKPIFLATPQQQSAYAKRMGVSHYLVVNAAGKVSVSPDMQKRITWLTQH